MNDNKPANDEKPLIAPSLLTDGLGMPKNNSKRRRVLKALNAKPKGRRNRFVQFSHTQQLPDLL